MVLLKAKDLREHGRGFIGALVFLGISLLFTMEAWQKALELPIEYLITYTSLSFGAIAFITSEVGFKQSEQDQRSYSVKSILYQFIELVAQSLTAAYLTLFLFGILTLGDPLTEWIRVGLLMAVPLSLGASLANKLLSGDSEQSQRTLHQKISIYTLGAFFLIFPLAPTREIELISAYTTWPRLGLIVAASLTVIYITLFEIEFRGQKQRTKNKSIRLLLGQTFLVYLIGFLASSLLLVFFGQFIGNPLSVTVRQIIILTFPAVTGASAGSVII